jgi:3'-phosphoadenosine 5'-phosphosulfate sulfotransferase (PAPS reductase)/FAD synthetase
METPEHIIRRAIEQYEPAHIFCMYSGGDDSLTASHFGYSQLGDLIDAAAYINTGIRLIENADYVPSVCKLLGWDFLEYRAKDQGQHYEELVMAYGFPGPDHHTKMFNRLKERAIRALRNDHPGGHVMLISGMRKQESARRMRLKAEPIQKDGRLIWCAPFFYWDHDQIRDYRAAHLSHVPKNPAREYLCMSGECLCGAYARKGELVQIETFFPETGRYLRDLERRVRGAGFPWGWDESPPEWWVRMQKAKKAGQADAFEEERADQIQMLCSSCNFKHELSEEE